MRGITGYLFRARVGRKEERMALAARQKAVERDGDKQLQRTRLARLSRGHKVSHASLTASPSRASTHPYAPSCPKTPQTTPDTCRQPSSLRNARASRRRDTPCYPRPARTR
jgi:hypothetical protein